MGYNLWGTLPDYRCDCHNSPGSGPEWAIIVKISAI